MRHYELIYIINPNLADEDYKAVIQKVKDLIQEQKGVVIKTQEWGKQTLAYWIKKFDKGFYVFIEFCAEQTLIALLERIFNLDDRILKFQTVKLADKADPEKLLKEQEGKLKKSDTQGGSSGQEQSSNPDNETGSDSEVRNGDE
ncbi:MAG: 30S ribosomal protein S6 [Deltaproteobacteria bacterium]|nr:30S ribosomal protein S6 [Deltaproteobacteria bacterium]